jgi:Leucine-rich repeat (LRR) protein
MSYTYTQFLQLREEDYDRVTGLNFGGNRLTQLPDTLGNCSQLESLNCCDNQLTFIPESIGNCSQCCFV